MGIILTIVVIRFIKAADLIPRKHKKVTTQIIIELKTIDAQLVPSPKMGKNNVNAIQSMMT